MVETSRRWKKKVLPLALILASATLYFSSCGLPKILYLYSPKDFALPSSNLLHLIHNTQNYDASEGSSQSFKGYEIYYRAYDATSAAKTAYNQLTSYAESFYNSPSNFLSSATSGLGFVRMISKASDGSTSAPPLISVNSPALDSNYDIYLNSGADWNLKSNSVSPSLDFSVFRNDGRKSSFYNLNDYTYADSSYDYSGESNPKQIYFVFFALSYGQDPTTIGQAVYSSPFLLTNINYVTYPPTS